MSERIDTAIHEINDAREMVAAWSTAENLRPHERAAMRALAALSDIALAQSVEIDRLTAALAEAEKIDQEDLHFVGSHPEVVAREMTKLRRQVAKAEDRGAAQMRERAARKVISGVTTDIQRDIRALPLRDPGASTPTVKEGQ